MMMYDISKDRVITEDEFEQEVKDYKNKFILIKEGSIPVKDKYKCKACGGPTKQTCVSYPADQCTWGVEIPHCLDPGCENSKKPEYMQSSIDLPGNCYNK